MLADMVMPSARSSAYAAAPVAGATNCAASRAREDACPGALRLHQADDGGLARVRVPGGVLDVAQATALHAAASRLGDGDVHLTSRGNVQLRGLGADSGVELARMLGGAGLLPSVAHERVRNIVASPLSGLDGSGHLDIRGRLTQLDRLVCESEELRELSGRFLFAVDDGRGDVAALGADVTLVAESEGCALLRIGAGRDASALRVASERAAAGAVAAAEVFLEAARECGVRAWRVADLPMAGGELARRTAQRLRGAARVVPVPAESGVTGDGPAPGLVTGSSGTVALCLLAPLGRLTGRQWELLVRTAERAGSGELRLTPWRGVVVPGLAPGRAPEALAALGAAGLVVDRASPWRGVGACAGRPGCAKSLTDVRADAATAVAVASDGAAGGPRALPVYWAGCERRCGHPRGDRVEVVAGADGYQVSVIGGSGAVRPVPRAPRSELAAIVAAARTGAGGAAYGPVRDNPATTSP
ncbi:precorrin-3B synthase [Streptomyces smyrnaeus]